MLSACHSRTDQRTEIFTSVHQLNELQLATATVTKVYTVRDPYYDDQEKPATGLDILDRLQRSLNVMEHTVKVGDRVGVYGIRCTYAAVIDLNQLSPDDIKVTEDGGIKHVSICLPAVQVKSLGNEFQTQVYHERYSGLRSGITESERTLMRQKAADQLAADIRQNRNKDLEQLRQTGNKKAVDFLTTMLQNMGYTASITIKKQ